MTSDRLYRVCLAMLWLSGLATFSWLAWNGSSYYATPLLERPHQEAYWTLKPGGSLGRVYGWAGTGLMLVMHVYSLRRRWRPLRKLGTLRVWLDFHIFCGVMGPLFILLHSSLKVQGLVALSFWSMVLVAASGVLGRYLYLQLPRRRSGDELTLSEMEEAGRRTAQTLKDDLGLADEDLERLDEIARADSGSDRGLVTLLLGLPFDGLRLRWHIRKFLARLPERLAGTDLRKLGQLALRRAQIQRRILLLGKLQELFHYWHVVHKPFAIVMYIFMFVHIGVVTVAGYGWSFG